MRNLMRVQVEVIPHLKQRYPTCGDWKFIHAGMGEWLLHIFISDTGDWRYNTLIGLHEQVEAFLCWERGIPEEVVTKFDLDFERLGLDTEPGDHPGSPYRAEHFHATNVERLVAEQLGVVWHEYERAIEKLFDSKPVKER